MTSDIGVWRFHRYIGGGGFGIVQLWRNDCTTEMIAIKKCRNDNNQLSDKQKERWIKEIITMNNLEHPNIVKTRLLPKQLTELQTELPVLCMEYCNHGDLRKVLNESSNCCGIEEYEALRIMDHVSSAVEYLHSRNFTHRDLKPENIVKQSFGKKTIYKVADFGYVCELGERTLECSAVGTVNYVAPELFWQKNYTCSVDYWSLGILFYEVITGNRPFFPDMNITPKWIDLMKTKKNEHICARMEDGEVVFSDEIERPTTISEHMRNQLADWFRVALQWDRKKRGKITDSLDSDKLVIFSLLKTLLSCKIIYVFVVPMYRIDTYAVNPGTSVQELQILIYNKTGINASLQILTDSESNVLSDTSSLDLNYTEDSRLNVFRKGSPLVENVPEPNLPLSVKKMLANPKKLLDNETIRRYYRTAVFFINQEMKLYHCYVIALSIKIDLSSIAIENLHEIIKSVTLRANNLLRELTIFTQSPDYDKMTENVQQSLNTTKSKVQKLLDNTEKAKSSINELTENFEKLKTLFCQLDWLKDWTPLYDKAKCYLEVVVKLERPQSQSPVEMVKLLYKAVEFHQKQLQCSQTTSVLRQIDEFDKNITILQSALDSFRGLTDLYCKNYEDIVNKAKIEEQNSFLASMSPYHSLIFDNIVLYNLIESLDDYQPMDEDAMDNPYFLS